MTARGPAFVGGGLVGGAVMWLLMAAAGVGCYSPAIGDHTFRCAPGGQCPEGFTCHDDDHLCWRRAQVGVGSSPGDALDGLAFHTDAAGDPSSPVAEGGAHDTDRPDTVAALDAVNAVDTVAVMDAVAAMDTVNVVDAGDVVSAGDVVAAVDAVDATFDKQADACTGDSCQRRPNGAQCTQGTMCESSRCVDGYCCNDACQSQCMACDVPSALGTCTTISGTPHGSRGACGGDGRCAGSCTGASGQCAFPAADVGCRAATCASGTSTPAGACNSAGACSIPAPTSCGAFRCNAAGSACLTACASDSDCAQAAAPYCVRQACVARRPLGERCLGDGECDGGHCVDGVCCDASCQGRCQACDLAGHLGTCTPVPSGQPHGGRPACGGKTTCAGFCGGALSGDCTFPGSATSCQCGGLIGLGACDGAGDCHTVGLGGVLGAICL